MTKHDEVRQILHDSGFKFKDGRSPLEMTDEEVERWLVAFMTSMSKLGRQLAVVFASLTESIVKAVEPLRELNQLLVEEETPTQKM